MSGISGGFMKIVKNLFGLDNTCEGMAAPDIYSENRSAIVWPALIYNADYTTRYSVVDCVDVTSDNAGCAYAIGNVPNFRARNIEVYLQRINMNGKRLWGKKGLLLAVNGTLGLYSLHVFAGKDNNVIATWVVSPEISISAGCLGFDRVITKADRTGGSLYAWGKGKEW